MWGLPLFPPQASTLAPQVDALFFFMLGVSAFFSLLIAGLIPLWLEMALAGSSRSTELHPLGAATRAKAAGTMPCFALRDAPR